MTRWSTPTSLLVVAVACLLAGCSITSSSGAGSDSAPSPTIAELPDDENVTIVFESYNYGSAGAWADTFTALIADFEAQHPNIDVVAQKPQGSSPNPASDTISSIQTQITAGSPPDVAQLGFSDLDFTINGLGAANLDELIGKDKVDALFDEGDYPFYQPVRDLGTWEGATYGVPFVLSTPVLYYNATLFEQAGLDPTDPPATWDEVSQAAQQITGTTGKGGIYVDCLTKSAKDWCFQSLVRSNGGTVISSDRTTLTYDDPAVAEVTDVMAQMVTDGSFPALAQMQAVEAFAAGELGMILESSAIQGTFAAGAKSGWKLQAASLPSFGDKPAVPTNSGAALYLFADDPLKQAAGWELINYLTSPEAYVTIANGIGYLPLREGMTEGSGQLKEWYDQNPLVAPNLKQLAAIEPWVSMPGDSYLQIRDGMMDAVESIVFSGAEPQTTLQQAAEAGAELMP
ncbi:extracellular solute-binding protein [Epidermidibacterium keratini]|uniref:Extracellular solute-binding protein n=1 Tax=Epidermidibacterium keratini TaxID=1891644 RepID=A0A7L4YHU4_9ACTN|nr:ABC transporter substrate-binding protein [Epidermidibacterium keratini]QHB98877.1 extracellular solute-binding protein [Epidermidibacterium keratini]